MHMHRGQIYRLKEEHVLPFVKSKAEREMLTSEFDYPCLGQ